MNNYGSRNDVPTKYKWDLSFLYENDQKWNEAYNAALEDIKKIENYIGKLNNVDKLKEFMDFDSNLGATIMDLYVYAMTKLDEDLSISSSQELLGKADYIDNLYSVAISFFEPELLSISKEEFDKIISDEKLKDYKYFLKKIYRYKDHVLSKEEEKIVSSLTNTASSYSQISSNMLNSCHEYGYVKMPDNTKEEIMTTNYRKIMKKLPRSKRKEVYNKFHKVLDQYSSISAGLLNDYVKTVSTLSNIYKFDSSWDRKLFGLELENKAFKELISVTKKAKKVVSKYNKLKADVLSLGKIKPWDSALDLYKIDKEYSVEDAQRIVRNAVSPLGEDYQKHFDNIVKNRSVDYCQYKNKCSGGYNVSTIDKKNSLILMSFNNDLTSISTLAHESGHNIHHQYLYENNDLLYRSQSILVCEVASLTNECLLSNYLINNGTKEEALSGLANIIDVILNNFVSAVQEGDMELKFHNYVEQGGTLTKEYMCSLAEESLKEFYPIRKLDSSYQTVDWTRRSHYYDAFYLFSYAICISAALYVSGEITKGNKEMLDKYLEFLKTGSNHNVLETYKVLGIDLNDRKVYEYAVKCLDEYIETFNKLYKEV